MKKAMGSIVFPWYTGRPPLLVLHNPLPFAESVRFPILNEKITHVGVEGGGQCIDLANDGWTRAVMSDSDCFAVWSRRMLARQIIPEPRVMILMNAEGFSRLQQAFQPHNWNIDFGDVAVQRRQKGVGQRMTRAFA